VSGDVVQVLVTVLDGIVFNTVGRLVLDVGGGNHFLLCDAVVDTVSINFERGGALELPGTLVLGRALVVIGRLNVVGGC
jgi:hypothetical protein